MIMNCPVASLKKNHFNPLAMIMNCPVASFNSPSIFGGPNNLKVTCGNALLSFVIDLNTYAISLTSPITDSKLPLHKKE